MKPSLATAVLTIVIAIWSVTPSMGSTIFYSPNYSLGATSTRGFIETDGTIGPITAANIVDWNLEYDVGFGIVNLTGPLSGNNATVRLYSSILDTLSATTTGLFFNFSETRYNFLEF